MATLKVSPANVVEGQDVKISLSNYVGNATDNIEVDITDYNKTTTIFKPQLHPTGLGEFVGTFNTAGLAEGNYLATHRTCQDVGIHVISPVQSRSDVTLQRSKSFPTKDQALWATIRSSTNAIKFERYQQFIDLVFDGATYKKREISEGIDRKEPPENLPLPFLPNLNIYGPYSYEVLKMATQAFLTLQCGLKPIGGDDIDEFFKGCTPQGKAKKLSNFLRERPVDSDEESLRSFEVTNLADQLTQYMGGGKGNLPYLNRIARALLAIGPNDAIDETLPYYNYILQHRVTNPSLIELIWSYWHEEGMLAQTMNAIALRFQNQRSGPNDPLAELEIDPLRPLNNMIWGFVQDRYNQLSVSRRASEYDHQYGLRLVGRAVPELNSADSRSKFIEAFHNLLYRTAVFYREDADTTVVSNAFPLLNALKDVHLLLAEGAHNQYGDLPWTARAEMLTQQWMLARPEMREFLRGRHMVPYQETWMGAVDAMKKLQGWSDTTISHFHELAVDGERILLSIRFGDWSDDLNLTEDNARNWARYWKPEIQRYLYGYLAVTGVDLMNEITDNREAATRYLQPSALLQRRLAGQSRQPAALAAAPRRQAIAAPSGAGMAALPRPQQTSRVSRVRAIRYEQGE
jgi:hypothetical protein